MSCKNPVVVTYPPDRIFRSDTLTRLRSVIVLAVISLSGCTPQCSGEKDKPSPGRLNIYIEPGYWRTQAIRDIIPFWDHAIDRSGGGFFTDVMFDGTVKPDTRKYTRAISQAVYGYCVAYLLTGEDKYLDTARHGMDYLKNKGWDNKLGGWYPSFNRKGEADIFGNKSVSDQSYCNTGPVFYYFCTRDTTALDLVGETHRNIMKYARDDVRGGFYTGVGYDWQKNTMAKSANAQIDVLTAYLIYYYMATRDRGVYSDMISVSDLISDRMLNYDEGSIYDEYTEDWKHYENKSLVEQNLRAGWGLVRVGDLTGNGKYQGLAEHIAKKQTEYAWDSRYYGWRHRYNRTKKSDAVDMKVWTTQAAGNMLMLDLYGHTTAGEYLRAFRESSYFWNKYILNREYGECYPVVYPDGLKARTKKGDRDKSAYHTMEHCLFNYLYLSLFVKKTDIDLYFRVSSRRGNDMHYVNPVEIPGVKIVRVEIEGREWHRYNPSAGYVILPRGENMKIHVVLRGR